jgi:hypothetical protein
MGGAMDYNTATAAQSHKEAAKWMTQESAQAFETNFWSPEIANGIASGQYSCKNDRNTCPATSLCSPHYASNRYGSFGT